MSMFVCDVSCKDSVAREGKTKNKSTHISITKINQFINSGERGNNISQNNVWYLFTGIFVAGKGAHIFC